MNALVFKDIIIEITLASYFCSCMISGAMYSGEPHKVSARPLGCRDLPEKKIVVNDYITERSIEKNLFQKEYYTFF